jgi:D-3-phosphoglycerate dehydrogenase
VAGLTVLVPDAPYEDASDLERAAAGPGVAWRVFRERDPGRVPDDAWQAADAVLAWHGMRIDGPIIDRLTRCRVIVGCGVGVDRIDADAAGRAGIAVCNVPDYGTGEVADHAMALILALTRGVVRAHEALRADPVAGWRSDLPPTLLRLQGARLGIVGLGRIGTAVAIRGRAFGLEVLAFDPYAPSGHEIAIGARRIEHFAAFLGAVDVVSIHAPLTAETRGMFGAAAFRAMRRAAILVNTARGAIVDTDALADALEASTIAGAALDVLPEEPPRAEGRLLAAFRADAPWLRGRLVLTPHSAWRSAASYRDCRRKAVETAVGYLVDGRLRNCVNRDTLVGPRPGPPEGRDVPRAAGPRHRGDREERAAPPRPD